MDLQELSTEQLIDIIHRQADDIAALQMEITWLKEQKTKQDLPAKEVLKANPVEVDGELYCFKLLRFIKGGKTYTAEQASLNEGLLRKILADPYQMILEKVNK